MGGENTVPGMSAARGLQLAALSAVGLLAFTLNLHVSLLEGTEGLYAHITRDMLSSHQFLHLTYLGDTYVNKPPFFFWLLGLSTSLFGDNETALRLPAVLFCLGTMALTYQLGRLLFSDTAGFVAALVVATTYVALWYGRRVLMDSALTFFITLAVLLWVLADRKPALRPLYVLSFVAMLAGTLIKGLHAFALPVLLMIGHSAVRRDFRAFKEPWFWAGAGLLAAVVGAVSWGLQDSVAGKGGSHFHVWYGLVRVFGFSNVTLEQYFGSRPIYWYVEIMWFVFFPWCVLIPSSLALLFRQRPLRKHPSELLVLLWVLVFFLAFSLAMGKREPYLMPTLPGLALMIGYYYHRVLASPTPREWGTPLLKVMLAVMAAAYVVALLFGPTLLQENWSTPPSVFPPVYVVPMLALCGVLAFALIRSKVRLALVSCAALAVGFMLGVVVYILPAIDQVASPKQISAAIKTWGSSASRPLVLYMPERPLTEDVVYYLTRPPGLPVLKTEAQLVDASRLAGSILIVAEKRHLDILARRPDLSLTTLGEYLQPRQKNYYVVSVRFNASNAPAMKT